MVDKVASISRIDKHIVLTLVMEPDPSSLNTRTLRLSITIDQARELMAQLVEALHP